MTSPSMTELASRLHAELERDRRVNLHEARVELVGDGDGLRLEGEVPDVAGKRIAANLARQIAPGQALADRICVRTQARGDDELGARAARHLGGEGAFRECAVVVHRGFRAEPVQGADEERCRLEIRAADGVIELGGRVPSLTHRRLAEVLCWWIEGCRRVENRIEVFPPQADSDDLITDAIRIVLEKDPLVNAGQLRAATAAGIVELSGLVASDAAHRLALRDTWAVPGVWDVYDRIEVRPGAT